MENQPEKMELSLNGDTFFEMKEDFNDVLNRTIINMQTRGATDATVTLKLAVSIERSPVEVGGNRVNYVLPTFKHDVSSVLQIKDKVSGQLTGEYALVWDDDDDKFKLVLTDDENLSLFDSDYKA